MTGTNSRPRETWRLGIIGSGIAGSSAASFARQALGSDVEIVVYERDGRVGGRIQETTIGGCRVETGASLIHSANQYLTEFMDRLGLHRTSEQETEWEKAGSFSQAPPFGIWNGRSFPLMAASSGWLTQARMLLRYGLTLRTVGRLGKEAVDRLLQVYDLQAAGTAFATPDELFRALGLYELTQQRSDDAFRAEGISDRFVQEFANGVSRGNYGQDARMNAFVNLISLATAGFAGGTLFSVREGNNRVCQGLLRISYSEVRTGCTVRRIERDSGGETASPTQYALTDDAGRREVFDAVILATPLEEAGIDFHDIDLPAVARQERPYQVTHRTLVSGRLKPGYFGLPSLQTMPRLVMTMERPEIPFSSLGVVGSTEEGQAIYSMFSREAPDEALLNSLFAERRETIRICWRAYPVLEPMPDWPPFQLGPALYYINAMESAVSTMETEAIGSRNVVNLLVGELQAES